MGRHNAIITNLIWRFLERTGAQLVSFVVSIVLARILMPEDYSIVALATIAITFINVLIDNGLGSALIQKKECDDLDYSTALWTNLIFCSILYFLVFFIVAPLMAVIYKNDIVRPVMRVMGISVFVSSIKNIQQAYISRHLEFKKFFWSTLLGTVISAVIGIYMAYMGFEVWALVAQYLINTCVDMLILAFVIDWKPRFVFSIIRLKSLVKYGYKLLLSAFINCTYDNFRQLIIGKIYQPAELAYYNRGKQFPALIMVNINTSIDSVLFPVLSKEQDDKKSLKEMASRSLTVSSYLLFPLLLGMAAIAEHMIPLFLTDKWNNTIIYIQIFCIFYMFYPMQTTNLNIIKAVGRSDLYLKLEVIQTIVGILLLVPVVTKGPIWIAVMYMIATVFNAIIIGFYAGKIVDYSLIRQIKDIMPYYALSLIMALITWGLGKMFQNHWVMLLQVFIGAVLYVLMSVAYKPSAYLYVTSMIRKRNGKDYEEAS